MTAAAWYLRSEQGTPLGIFIQERESPAPLIDELISTDSPQYTWRNAQVVGFQEMAHACSMRRYSVTIRILS
jgi:hypothetical protein